MYPDLNPGSHLSTASISQMSPKVILRAYFGHDGTFLPVVVTVLAILTLLMWRERRLQRIGSDAESAAATMTSPRKTIRRSLGTTL
jgi:hypothetical protein